MDYGLFTVQISNLRKVTENIKIFVMKLYVSMMILKPKTTSGR